MALAAYRHVLRSTRIAFQGVTLIPPRLSTQTRYYGIPTKSRYLGDLRTFDAARIEARKGFEKNRQLSSGGEEATQEIRQAEDVAKILRENIVQGQGDAAEEDHYSASWKCAGLAGLDMIAG